MYPIYPIYPILSYLSYLILSYPILSYLILSYPILSYLILSYPIYPIHRIYLINLIYLSIYLSNPFLLQLEQVLSSSCQSTLDRLIVSECGAPPWVPLVFLQRWNENVLRRKSCVLKKKNWGQFVSVLNGYVGNNNNNNNNNIFSTTLHLFF